MKNHVNLAVLVLGRLNVFCINSRNCGVKEKSPPDSRISINTPLFIAQKTY